MFSLREADSTCKMPGNGSHNSCLLGDALCSASCCRRVWGAAISTDLFPYTAVTVRYVGWYFCARLYLSPSGLPAVPWHRTEHRELSCHLRVTRGPSTPISVACTTQRAAAAVEAARGGEMHGCGEPWPWGALGVGCFRLGIMEGDSWQCSQPCQGETGLF